MVNGLTDIKGSWSFFRMFVRLLGVLLYACNIGFSMEIWVDTRNTGEIVELEGA